MDAGDRRRVESQLAKRTAAQQREQPIDGPGRLFGRLVMKFQVDFGQRPDLAAIALQRIEVGQRHRSIAADRRDFCRITCKRYGPIWMGTFGGTQPNLPRAVGPGDAIAAGQIDAEYASLDDLKIGVAKADLGIGKNNVATFAATHDGVGILEFVLDRRSVPLARRPRCEIDRRPLLRLVTNAPNRPACPSLCARSPL